MLNSFSLMLTFIQQYWMEAVFIMITGGITYLWNMLRKKVSYSIKEQHAASNGVKALLKDRIIQSYHFYMEKQEIPIYALESVLSMYEEYHNLGGNGTITQLVEELKELPKK